MRKTAFLFAGQGAQKVGMGLYLLPISEAARRLFDLASETLGYDVATVIRDGPAERLAETEITQPAILTASLAVAAALDEAGVRPDVAAGLSLGEYGALVVSGAIGAPDALRVVRERGRLMQEAVPLGTGGMVAVLGMEADAVEDLCRMVSAGVVEPANFNAPGQVVVAGELKGLAAFKNLARQAGARRLVDLPVSAPFHCSLLEPAGRRLREVLRDVPFRDPSFPVLANVTAKPLTHAGEIPENLVRQVSHPVRFEATLRAMVASGVDTFIEVGPGTSLSGFVRRVATGAHVLHTDDLEGFQTAAEPLEGVAEGGR